MRTSLKLVAAGLASVLGQAAHADIAVGTSGADLVLFGTVDGAIESVSATGNSGQGFGNVSMIEQSRRVRGVSNSSDFGIKGSRELGSTGLKGVFQFAYGMDGYATGTGAATMKDAFLGLKGGFGELRFGQNSGAGKTFGGKVENNYGATSFAEGGVLYNQIGGTKTKGGDRAKNSLLYISPNYAGLTVNGLFSSYNNDNVATGTGTSDVKLHSRQTDLWLDYVNGPWFMNASLMSIQDPQANGAKPGATCSVNNANFCLKPVGAPTSGVAYNDQLNSQKFAVAYTLPSATRIHALTDKSSYEVSTALLGGVKRERTSWQVGVLQDFGAHHVWLQYGKNSNYKDNGVEAANTAAKYFNLGYSYDMSKEAIVRVYYAKVSNDAKVAYDFTTNPVTGALNNGASPQGIGVGVRYKF
jgi:hypothetical protein